MPDRISLHAPVLVNTIGHCGGAIAFGILLYLLLLDWRRATAERSVLPSIAAGLAFLWNIGSLIGMATAPAGDPVADTIIAASFSVLSFLPAVLLHISLRSRPRVMWIAGYAVSCIAALLHVGDLITSAPRFHYAAILLVTIGFGALTTISVIREAFSGPGDGSGGRLAGAMVLFLFAISFVHFESAHDIKAWSGEAALHHAGIPLALFVLLQDYRFLLLDTFIRLLVNGMLAAGAVWISVEAEAKLRFFAHASGDPFQAGLIFTGACLLLILFAQIRVRAQRFLTYAVFLRVSPERTASKLRDLAPAVNSETDYLAAAARTIAEFFSARRFEIMPWNPREHLGQNGAQAAAPFRFSRGDGHVLLLGSRKGGRRYLSEDLEMLERFAAIVCEQVERFRSSEMQALVSQAELRALQAQINPHFFFNSLNTLYGVIARDNSTARQLVLNLADLFRHAFAMNSELSPLAEEIRIVRAYLEIEQLRLGSKLRTEFDIDESVLVAELPVLSIQPLVENAVKHGVACRTGDGFVRLSVRRHGDSIVVSVSNSGVFGQSTAEPSGHGVGMENVRRRLTLRYGNSSNLEVSTTEEVTMVRFLFPLAERRVAGVAAA